MNEINGVIALIIIIFCLFIWYKSYQHMGKPTIDAIVIKSKFIKDDNNYLLTVKYTVDEKEYVNKVISKKEKAKDDKIYIRYDKNDPTDIDMDKVRTNSNDGLSELICHVCIMFCMPLILFGLMGTCVSYFMSP